ncbi:MAG: hypothetical protein XD69_1410 [Clostridia bacterium 62_21]|nr:MAG: hypothetical protein XD69_1410 [Clostridia bacterium 62_21]
MQGVISLTDWLTQNPGPYWVQVLAARTDRRTGETHGIETCGIILCEADKAEANPKTGLLVFEGEHGFAAFETRALRPGFEPEPGMWAGRYANLTVPVPGFGPEAAIVVYQKGKCEAPSLKPLEEAGP